MLIFRLSFSIQSVYKHSAVSIPIIYSDNVEEAGLEFSNLNSIRVDDQFILVGLVKQQLSLLNVTQASGQ